MGRLLMDEFPMGAEVLSGMVRVSITAYYPAVCRAQMWMHVRRPEELP